MSRTLIAASALGATLAVASASASPAPSVDLRGFSPPPDPRGGLRLESAVLPEAWAWDAGAWLAWARRPVVLRDAADEVVGAPVDQQLTLDVFLALGVADRLALALSLPSALYQTERLDASERAVLGTAPLPRTALGDAAFDARAVLVPSADLGGFGLLTVARVTLPSGDPRSYLGQGAPSGELRLLGALSLLALELRATGGARIRGEQQEFAGQSFGHALPWGLGAVLRPPLLGLDDDGSFSVLVESFGEVALSPRFAQGPTTPVQGALSLRTVRGDVSLVGGVELPLRRAVGAPQVRAVLGAAWSPRLHDADGDGISDDLDQCEELPEDRDGIEDDDGCPDFDDDGDGVPDTEDQCRLQEEDEDGFEDEDGCPDLDNDGDGVLDDDDLCPDGAAGDTPGPRRGCALQDRDGDGIDDSLDRCPELAEDRDGQQDEDGCPDLDDDGDGVPDAEDACPRTPGEAREDPKLHGCPSPDRDGDTFADAMDRCPDQPEAFDGFEDDDGCPDAVPPPPRPARAPLLTLERGAGGPVPRFRVAPAFVVKGGAPELDPRTEPSVRALAAELARHPGWVVLVGVRPAAATPEAEQEALTRSFLLVQALRSFAHRDGAAETVGWAAVAKQPGAARAGVGFLLLTEPSPPR